MPNVLAHGRFTQNSHFIQLTYIKFDFVWGNFKNPNRLTDIIYMQTYVRYTRHSPTLRGTAAANATDLSGQTA